MLQMIKLSIRRRKREIWYVSFVTFLAVFFMIGINLFQDIMNQYRMEQNYQNYGEWILSSTEKQLSHPYLVTETYCKTGMTVGNAKGPGNVTLGAGDEGFYALGRISVYEGRLPEAENEIVMDVSVLARMGLDYELGQEIKFFWWGRDAEGKRCRMEKTYLLVGTLKGFSNIWKTNEEVPLPQALVTLKELETYEAYNESKTTWFYQLGRQYAHLDLSELVNSFVHDEAWEKQKDIVYNSYVYDSQLWGNRDAFEWVSNIMIFIAIGVIGYLLSTYTAHRRSSYYRYRCMGADKAQVRGLIVWESLFATVPYSILGVILPYVLGWTIGFTLAKVSGYPFFYRIDSALLGRQLLSIVLVIALPVLWTCITIREKSLSQNTQEVQKKHLRMLHRIAKHCKKPERQVIFRGRKLHRRMNALSVLVSICVCGALLLCAQQVYTSYIVHWQKYLTWEDYSLRQRVECESVVELPEEGVIMTFGFSIYDMYVGMDDEKKAQVLDLYGVDSIREGYSDHTHFIEWEGDEHSPIKDFMVRVSTDGDKRQMGYLFQYFEELDVLMDLVEEKGDVNTIDWEKIQSGEQVILVLNTNFSGFNSVTQESLEEEIHDETIKPGDILIIRDGDAKRDTGVGTAVTVADVYYVNADMEYSDDYMLSNVTVFASNQLAKRVAETEGQTLEANKIDIFFDQNASFEATDKQLAAYAKLWEISYIPKRETRENFRDFFVSSLGSYGAMFVLILVVYLILKKSFLDNQNNYRKQQYLRAKQIGMEDVQYRRLLLKECILENLWLLLGIPVGYFFLGYLRYLHLKETVVGTVQVSCQLIGAFTNDVMLLTADYLIFNVYHVCMLMVALVLMVVVMVWSCYVSTNAIRRN